MSKTATLISTLSDLLNHSPRAILYRVHRLQNFTPFIICRVHTHLLSVFARGVGPSHQNQQDDDDGLAEEEEGGDEAEGDSNLRHRRSSNSTPEDIVRSSEHLLNT